MGWPSFNLCRSSCFALFKKLQHGYNTLLDLVTDIQVNFVGTTNGVGDVFLENIESFIEFTKNKNFIRGLWVEQGNCIDVPMGHSKNIIGLLHEFSGQHPASLAGNIDL